MMKKILCIAVSMVLITGVTAHASEGGESHNRNDEIIDRVVPKEKAVQLDNMITADERYEIQTYANDDLDNIYEENDTIETAYPYSQTIKIAYRDGDPLGHFRCNYAYTQLETANDVDYFMVKVRTGYRYVAALKNVWGSQVRDIRLYYQAADGTWRYIQAKEKISGQTIFHFVPTVNTYYIEISGEPAPGYKHNSDTNWFAVVPDGTIDERPFPSSNNPSCALH